MELCHEGSSICQAAWWPEAWQAVAWEQRESCAGPLRPERESVCVQEAGAGPCVRAEMRARGDKNPAGQQSRLSTRSGEQEGFEHHINDGIQ